MLTPPHFISAHSFGLIAVLVVALLMWQVNVILSKVRTPGIAREVLFKISAWISDMPMEMVNDPSKARKLLTNNSDKGCFIEERVSMSAWSPILSLESVNGDLWRELRNNFHRFFNTFKGLNAQSLERHSLDFFGSEMRRLMEDKSATLDSPQVCAMVVRNFGEWLTKESMSDELCAQFVEASYVWRKEVATKGKGDPTLKQSAMQSLVAYIKESHLSTFDDWSDPKIYSIIAQPFIISPMINYSDILVELFAQLSMPTIAQLGIEWSKRGYDASRKEIHAYINESLRISHPFPVLERYHKSKHYFIPLDCYPQTQASDFSTFDINKWMDSKAKAANRYKWMPFGAGPRQCAGKHFALASMGPLLYNIAIHCAAADAAVKIVPSQNHKWSGRCNDDEDLSIKDTLYQLKVALDFILYSLRK